MHNLISAINSGTWFIDAKHAEGYLPVAVNFLLGKSNPIVENMSESRELHRPYFVSAENPFQINDLGEGRMTDPDKAPKNSVAIIPVQGVITSDDQYSGPSGSKSKMQVLDKIKSNQNIIGVVFDFDTGGGEAASTRPFSKKIKNLGKPTVGLVRNMSASAGYWLASACDVVMLEDEVSEVGSIGAYRSWADFSGYFQNMGVNIKTVYAKQSTEKNAMFAKRDDDTTDTKEDLSELTQFFINDVIENRSLDANSPALKGKMYRGQKAIDIGLADKFGSMEDAIKYVGGQAFQIDDQNTDDTNDDPNQVTTKNKDTMKIKDTWSAIKAFCGAEKTELKEEDVDKLNTELQSKTDDLVTKTSESDQLTTDLAAEKAAHKITTDSLTAEQKKVTDLTTEKADLETKLAAKPAVKGASPDNGGDKGGEDDTYKIPVDAADEEVEGML